MNTKVIPVQQAVGMTLCHDHTRIVPGESKGPAFRKGHVVQAEDIPVLLAMGKEHIYVLDLAADEIHEDEAAIRLGYAAAGSGIRCSAPKEGKVELNAAQAGLLLVDLAKLEAVNLLPDIVLSTLPRYTPVTCGDLVAGTKVIPLAVPDKLLTAAAEVCARSGVLSVRPFLSRKAAIIVTGSEVYHGRIQDAFGPLLQQKVEALGGEVLSRQVAPDDKAVISRHIETALTAGADIVLVSGGMSVDPDDVTPAAIRQTGATVETYGAPVLPGAMFMLAYHGQAAIMGIPACGMFHRTTVLDLVLPRLMTGEQVRKKDIVALAHGGLCRRCPECRYPICSFGLTGIPV